MGWRFRKSFSPLPGVRLTLSPSGISTSVGVGPFRVTHGTRGTAFTANVPGTGLSFRQPLGDQRTPAKFTSAPAPFGQSTPPELPAQPPRPDGQQLQEVRSASTQEMTSKGLHEFKRLLLQAKTEQIAIANELATARESERQAVNIYNRWRDGWLFRRVRKQRFQQLQAAAQHTSEVRAELEEQQGLASLPTQIELPDAARSAFHRMCDAFAGVANSAQLWDTVQERDTNRFAERTIASRSVLRKPVKFRLGKADVIDSQWDVPHLGNANGGDLYLYPGFILYFVSEQAFSLLELAEVDLIFEKVRFHETEAVPHDSKVIDRTWAKVNKDGSPDRRFKDNFEIPVALYGQITLRSPTGMREEYLVSNPEAAEGFAAAWQEFRRQSAA